MQPVTTAALLGALVLAGQASAATAPSAPTTSGCLRAWNAPVNSATRRRLVAYSTWQASLSGGVVSSIVWRRGSRPQSATAAACLLELARDTDRLFVTGVWAGEAVARWKFGDLISGQSLPPTKSNVRLLPDGRISPR